MGKDMVEKQLSDMKTGEKTNTDRGPALLTTLLPGERAKIVALGAGSGRQRHFRTMGLKEGKIVEIRATQPARGPLVIDVEGTLIAIGRGMARQILIQKI